MGKWNLHFQRQCTCEITVTRVGKWSTLEEGHSLRPLLMSSYYHPIGLQHAAGCQIGYTCQCEQSGLISLSAVSVCVCVSPHRLAVRGACLGASILFLAVNVACAVLVRARRAEPWAVVLARVLINDSLFVLGAVSLALCLCLVARGSPSTRVYLEAKVRAAAVSHTCGISQT